MEDNKPMPQPSNPVELNAALQAFQQILEIMPNDRVALESLFEAQLGVGNTEEALHYLKRLADVVVAEEDEEAILAVADKLNFLGDVSPEARQYARQLEEFLARRKGGAGAGVAEAALAGKAANISAEIALAWNLFQEGQLTQEEYSNVTHDLTELSFKKMDVPVSLLHILQDRDFKNKDKIFNHIAHKSRVPCLALSCFEIQKEVARMLPLEFAARLGAIAFDRIGEEFMVAVLNPFDLKLQARIREQLGQPCHFYLVTAAEYDAAMDAVRKAFKDAEDSPG